MCEVEQWGYVGLTGEMGAGCAGYGLPREDL